MFYWNKLQQKTLTPLLTSHLLQLFTVSLLWGISVDFFFSPYFLISSSLFNTLEFLFFTSAVKQLLSSHLLLSSDFFSAKFSRHFSFIVSQTSSAVLGTAFPPLTLFSQASSCSLKCLPFPVCYRPVSVATPLLAPASPNAKEAQGFYLSPSFFISTLLFSRSGLSKCFL